MKDEFRIGPHRPEEGPFPTEVEGTVSQYLLNPRGEVDGLLLDGVILEDGTLLHFPPHAGRQFAKLIRKGELLAAVGFGTVNDFGQTIAVAMLGRSADALALVEPPPAKPKRHPEDRKVREEES